MLSHIAAKATQPKVRSVKDRIFNLRDNYPSRETISCFTLERRKHHSSVVNSSSNPESPKLSLADGRERSSSIHHCSTADTVGPIIFYASFSAFTGDTSRRECKQHPNLRLCHAIS